MATLGILRFRGWGLLVLLAMALVLLATPRARAGALEAWGYNGDGQFGNGTTTNSLSPVAVTGMSSGVTTIAAGFKFSLAAQNGGLYAWGDNTYGQLGDGTTNNSTTPVGLTGVLSSGVTAVAAGNYFSLVHCHASKCG